MTTQRTSPTSAISSPANGAGWFVGEGLSAFLTVRYYE
jgi:hypothetical protein